jgi:hypothetical protein
VLVHQCSRLGTAIAIQAIEIEGGNAIVAKCAFECNTTIHRFGCVMSHPSVLVLPPVALVGIRSAAFRSGCLRHRSYLSNLVSIFLRSAAWGDGGIIGCMNRGILFSDQVSRLADKLRALSQAQFEALETASYIRMSDKEGREYDERHERIGELCGLIGVFLVCQRTGKGLPSGPRVKATGAWSELKRDHHLQGRFGTGSKSIGS